MTLWQTDGEVPFWLSITFVPVFGETYTVLYPALPWLGIMLLGWVFGQLMCAVKNGVHRFKQQAN
ncbi:heparan-alpha-glucosaminide N-acetyltransferase domain-containing protein [uncultured Nitrosomonas sp.]|uniref:heparan-alpha-glucosaminide N-acetyltransferase domain-containing protein n=1 Tax=uncultured Nitrosomonas sp. TaxID=156424 RepID=UPI0025DC8B60|nr:heparan-alpha-glucosaminide N-acetyltransferase domain-containing protein [uncultured Nitrosomonas sp.]